jgi:hypothetical protein
MQSRRNVPWRKETFHRHDAGRHLNQKPAALMGRRVSQIGEPRGVPIHEALVRITDMAENRPVRSFTPRKT